MLIWNCQIIKQAVALLDPNCIWNIKLIYHNIVVVVVMVVEVKVIVAAVAVVTAAAATILVKHWQDQNHNCIDELDWYVHMYCRFLQKIKRNILQSIIP